MAAMDVDLEAEHHAPGLGFLWREPQWSVSNQILESYEDAVEELRWAKRAGAKSIIDPTPIGLGRKPEALRRLSTELDLHIVGATGYYREKFHPPEVETMTVAEIEETHPPRGRRGHGWARTSAPGSSASWARAAPQIMPSEEKVLIAAARVQHETGVPIMVHTEGVRDTVLRAIALLDRNGADIEQRSHLPCEPHSVVGRTWSARGATIGLDCFRLDLLDRLGNEDESHRPGCGSMCYGTSSTPVMETRCS